MNKPKVLVFVLNCDIPAAILTAAFYSNISDFQVKGINLIEEALYRVKVALVEGLGYVLTHLQLVCKILYFVIVNECRVIVMNPKVNVYVVDVQWYYYDVWEVG
jgi:hypothetical protein